MVDKFGNISFVNKQAEVIFGYKRKELIGQKIELLIPNPYAHNHSPHLNNFVKNPQTRAMGAGRDLFAKRKDSSIFPVEISNENMVIASVVDITERKKIELKNKELEQFTYIVSHDLQEPLNTIISFINLVEDNSGHKFSELDKKSFKYINEATFRMHSLIKSLLNYGRLGNNSKIKKVDCHKLLHSVCKDLSSLIKSTSATIHIEQLPTINAYKTEMRLLFQNLLDNAIKFHKKDTSPEIHISIEKGDSNYKFSIKDNGIGID